MISLLLASVLLNGPTDWPARLQQPYAKKPIPAELGLTPLLNDSISTPEQWAKARTVLLTRWQQALGPAPQVPARLDVRSEAVEEQAGFRRELLSFASEGDDRIAAYLLTPPDGKPGVKRPAVVVFHPTTRGDNHRQPAGVLASNGLDLGIQLVRRGYVVLCPECYIMKAGGGRDNIMKQVAALEKRRPGWTGMGKMTFDASRCVDFLTSRPDVDPKRIAAAGFSLGAKETLYALAFEPRYAAGVFNEGGIGLRMSNWFDPWYLTAKLKPRVPELEHHQLLALIAPRPFLILGGDSADGDASWPFVAQALPVYRLLGAVDRIGLENHRGQHSFPEPARKLAWQWLNEMLTGP